MAETLLWSETWTGYSGDHCDYLITPITPWSCTVRDSNEYQHVIQDGLNSVLQIKAVAGGSEPALTRTWVVAPNANNANYQFQFDYKGVSTPSSGHEFWLAMLSYNSFTGITFRLSMTDGGYLRISESADSVITGYLVPSSFRTYVIDIDGRDCCGDMDYTVTVKNGSTIEFSRSDTMAWTQSPTGLRIGAFDDASDSGEGYWDNIQIAWTE